MYVQGEFVFVWCGLRYWSQKAYSPSNDTYYIILLNFTRISSEHASLAVNRDDLFKYSYRQQNSEVIFMFLHTTWIYNTQNPLDPIGPLTYVGSCFLKNRKRTYLPSNILWCRIKVPCDLANFYNVKTNLQLIIFHVVWLNAYYTVLLFCLTIRGCENLLPN